MAKYTADLISSLYDMIETMIHNNLHRVIQGQWNYSEDVDSNLSSVTIEGIEFKYIRKLSHVTGLVNGDSVLLLSAPDCPLVIIGKIVGNITLATQI